MRLYISNDDANIYWLERGTLHAVPLPLSSGIIDMESTAVEELLPELIRP